MDECIMKLLRGRGRTVLLATHHVQHLPRCDRVCIMQPGGVMRACGTLEELQQEVCGPRRVPFPSSATLLLTTPPSPIASLAPSTPSPLPQAAPPPPCSVSARLRMWDEEDHYICISSLHLTSPISPALR